MGIPFAYVFSLTFWPIWGRKPACSNVSQSHVMLTDVKDKEQLHVFTADIPAAFPDMFDFPDTAPSPHCSGLVHPSYDVRRQGDCQCGRHDGNDTGAAAGAERRDCAERRGRHLLAGSTVTSTASLSLPSD